MRDEVNRGSHNTYEPLETMADGAVVRRSAISHRVGGYDYPLRHVNACMVCVSDARFDIERALLAGMPHLRIERELNAQGISISRFSIRNHLLNGHMPIEQTVRRVALEQRQKELGRADEEIEDTLVDHMGFLREVQRRTYERMSKGEIEPDVADGVTAAKALAAIDATAGGTSALDHEILRTTISQMMMTARSFMDDASWGGYAKALQENPVLRVIDAQMRKQDATEAELET